MLVNSFIPFGSTYLINDAAPTFIPALLNPNLCYRIRNLTGASAYFAWRPKNASGAVPSDLTAPVAPTGNNPGANVIGMISTSVEIFGLPTDIWLIASSGATFEVTPGEGI